MTRWKTSTGRVTALTGLIILSTLSYELWSTKKRIEGIAQPPTVQAVEYLGNQFSEEWSELRRTVGETYDGGNIQPEQFAVQASRIQTDLKALTESSSEVSSIRVTERYERERAAYEEAVSETRDGALRLFFGLIGSLYITTAGLHIYQKGSREERRERHLNNIR